MGEFSAFSSSFSSFKGTLMAVTWISDLIRTSIACRYKSRRTLEKPGMAGKADWPGPKSQRMFGIQRHYHIRKS